ncbi:MAG: 3-deoxy-8-phosphooctulonate synthase, partial [Candidatus Neomarinimicrobiota bacterium]
MKVINITEKISFGGKNLPLIAGPCVIESRDHSLYMALQIKKITDKLLIPFVFKSSFDKANRTSITSFRGPGIDEGLKILAEVKNEINVPIITDIHLPEQADIIAGVVDIIQIPAFLCRQTDLLIAA